MEDPVLPKQPLPVQIMGQGSQAVGLGNGDRDVQGGAAIPEHLLHRGQVGVEHRVAAGLKDAGLGGGDGLHGGAQELGVVQADVGEDRDLRGGDHVGGVEFAAHTRLQDHNVAALPVEPGQGDGSDQLKLGGQIRHGLGEGPDIVRDRGQCLPGDHFPVDLHPFPEVDHVGRDEQTGPIAGSGQDGGEGGGGAALAVGAHDVDVLGPQLGIPQPVHQLGNAAEPGHGALPGHRVDVLQSFFVSHRILQGGARCAPVFEIRDSRFGVRDSGSGGELSPGPAPACGERKSEGLRRRR